ncbi:MAG: isopentenyl transferase family protein [Defluviitaleaceae bacterium]|nr:isopentenyl transferase family protein [Defluviitaleaceae bacterium]
MKNILIWGPARVGKTTLAKKLQNKLGHSIVCTDSLVTAFGQSFPQLEIGHGYPHVAMNFAPFIAQYLCVLARKSKMLNGDKFVAALTHFSVDDVFAKMEELLHTLNSSKLHEEFTLIGLTYSHKSWEDIRRDVQTYDTADDWTFQLTHNELDAFCKGSVEHNKFFAKKFIEHNFEVYDVSYERDLVLDKIVADLLETKKLGRVATNLKGTCSPSA